MIKKLSMSDIRYFYKQAIRSTRKGKLHVRSWSLLVKITILEIKCLFLTGRTLKEIENE